MPDILIRTVDNGPQRKSYKRGDPILALNEGHVYGRKESLAVWISEGRDPAEWPGGFVIVHITGITKKELDVFMQPGLDSEGNYYRRLYSIREALNNNDHPEPAQGTNEVTVDWSVIKDRVKKKNGLSEIV